MGEKTAMNTTYRRTGMLVYAALVLVLMTGFLLASAQRAYCQMQANNGCLQEVAGFGLNCTGNDVSIARVTNIVINDDGCAYPGDTVDFTATFEVKLTATERHDIGIYFAIDGDPNKDGAITGNCSINTLPYTPDSPWVDLDGTNDPYPGGHNPSGVQDTCGDIDTTHNPLYPVIRIVTRCIDPDNDGYLNLPYCTSWRQPGDNDLCTSPLDTK